MKPANQPLDEDRVRLPQAIHIFAQFLKVNYRQAISDHAPFVRFTLTVESAGRKRVMTEEVRLRDDSAHPERRSRPRTEAEAAELHAV